MAYFVFILFFRENGYIRRKWILLERTKGERKQALEEADEMNGSSRLVTAIKSKYKRVTMATKGVHLNRMVMKVF